MSHSWWIHKISRWWGRKQLMHTWSHSTYFRWPIMTCSLQDEQHSSSCFLGHAALGQVDHAPDLQRVIVTKALQVAMQADPVCHTWPASSLTIKARTPLELESGYHSHQLKASNGTALQHFAWRDTFSFIHLLERWAKKPYLNCSTKKWPFPCIHMQQWSTSFHSTSSQWQLADSCTPAKVSILFPLSITALLPPKKNEHTVAHADERTYFFPLPSVWRYVQLEVHLVL